jgi:serine/threonine protein kinase
MSFGNLKFIAVRKELRAFTLWIAQDGSGQKFYAFRLRPVLAANPEVREGLAKSLAPFQALSHPCLARFYGVQGQGEFWALYEYADGEFLSELLASREKLPLKQALEVGLKVSEGLAELHRAGLVNGGLSPDEVLILPDGGVKLLGIGLPQAIYQLGVPYRIWLDPLWIAPEMHANRPLAPTSDVYSLGLLLQRMIAGRQEILALGSSRLAEIINTCLSPEPHARYRNANQVRMLLMDELKSEPKQAEAVLEEEEALDWVALLLGAIALLAVVGVVVLWTIVYYRYAGVF